MDVVKEYLTSSTIHGLYYIGSTNSRLLRFFWIIIIVASFTISLSMICTSFSSWEKAPVISTIETKPISEARFPTVTVCPPEGSNTILNYDISNSENHTLDDISSILLTDAVDEFVLKESFEMFVQEMNALSNFEYIQSMYNERAMYELVNSNSTAFTTFTTNFEKGKLTTAWFRSKFRDDRFEKSVGYEYDVHAENGQGLYVSLDIVLKKKHEEVRVFKNKRQFVVIKESGQYNFKMTEEDVKGAKSLSCVFVRNLNERDYSMWQHKQMTGMSFNWTITGQPGKKIKTDINIKAPVMPNIRTAMNLFFHWTEANSSAHRPVEESLSFFNSFVQYSRSSNKRFLTTSQHKQVLQSILDVTFPNMTLKDDLILAKRNITSLEDDLVQQAYNFYLTTVMIEPKSVYNFRYFFGGFCRYLRKTQTIVRLLFNNLKMKSVFNREQNLLKLIDKRIFKLRFQQILSFFMTTSDLNNLENCPLSLINKTSCLWEDTNMKLGR